MNSTCTPIWVVHPATGQRLNVASLFTALERFDRRNSSPLATGGVDLIRQTIRTLNVTEHDPTINTPGHMANLYHDLHQLEDMFESMTEQVPH